MLMEDGKKCVVVLLLDATVRKAGELSEVTAGGWKIGFDSPAEIQTRCCHCTDTLEPAVSGALYCTGG